MSWQSEWSTLETAFHFPEQPEGSMTLLQLADRFGVTKYNARTVAKRLIAEGKLTAVECLVLDSRGRKQPGLAYLPVSEAAQ